MLTESGFFKEDATPVADAARSSVPPDLAPGRRVADKYELLRKIGIGAMGEVWAAKHLSLDEEVAIKLVLRDVQHDDGSTADSRFLLEARVARMLSRKTRHIVSVTDHGDDGPVAYLVMELLGGEPLDVRLARSGALGLEKVVPVVEQVARALAVAHEAGIVHRDLKPGNVFLTLDEDGKPLIKILDFGIAKLSSGDDGQTAKRPPAAAQAITNHDAKHKTLRGFLLGTPAYMSPEQARAKAIDHRADVWALAVIAYHLLTTQFPFDGLDAEALFKRIARVQPTPITDYRKDLPPVVVAVFERAFSKKIEDRFQSAEDFAAALDLAAGNSARSTPVLGGPSRVAAGAKVESDIVAAGVPRGSKRLPAIAAAALLAAGGLFAVAYGKLGHDDVKASGLAAGAAPEPTSRSNERSAVPAPDDDSIPPPAPVAKATAAVHDEAPSPPEPAPNASANVEAAAVMPAVAAPPPAVTTTPAPRPPADKSEVF